MFRGELPCNMCPARDDYRVSRPGSWRNLPCRHLPCSVCARDYYRVSVYRVTPYRVSRPANLSGKDFRTKDRWVGFSTQVGPVGT